MSRKHLFVVGVLLGSAALFSVPTWSSAETPTSDDAAGQLRLRRELGLSADEAAVDALLAAAPGDVVRLPDSQGGLVLRPDEAAALDHRFALQRAWSDFADATLTADSPLLVGYAGAFLDSSKGAGNAVLHVYATAPVAEQLAAAVADGFPVDLRSFVQVEAVSRSLDELHRELDDLAASALTAPELDGLLTGTSIDIVNNGLKLYTTAGAGGQVRGTIERADVRALAPIAVEETDATDESIIAPSILKNQSIFGIVYAGLQITNSGGGACTSSIATQHAAYGKFLVTAGHCGALNQGFNQGGSYVGNLAVRNFGGGAATGRYDAGLIWTEQSGRGQLGRVHINNADDAHNVDWIVGMNGDAVGNYVCNSGYRTTGLDGYQAPTSRCGTILDTAYDPSPSDGTDPRDPVGVYTYATAYYRKATFLAAAGDSGGLIYVDLGGYGTAGLGIQSGCVFISATVDICSTNSAFYSHLPYVLSDWGLTPTAP